MKIYTKSGDRGETSLVSGRRLSKASAEIDAYGNVDELNSFVGDLATELSDEGLVKDISYIQNTLFNIGSLLAKDGADFPDYPTLIEEDITYLENRIDFFNVSLAKMTAFILPGGSRSIAKAHICRTVCRRAERRVIDVFSSDADKEIVIKYLNRLSDYFFVMARYCHFLESIPELKWDNKHREKI